jgi:cell division inhibitor SepF
MATAFRKMGVYLGLVEDDDYADGGGTESYGALARDPQYHRREVEVAPARAGYEAASPEAEGYDEYDVAYEQPPQRITTLHPRTYNEAKTIGEHFREGVPVIMNLSDMNDADAKRLVDFGAGLVFGLRGTIERVTSKVFLLSPEHVEVGGEDSEPVTTRTVFNQS